jgi:hypothetical protein
VDERRRQNDLLKNSKTVELTGPQRYMIRRMIERVPPSARTDAERDLLDKVWLDNEEAVNEVLEA